MTHKEYNGWTNYETWLAKLWMDNDEGSYSYWQEEAENAVRAGFGDDETRHGAISRLAQQLEEEHKAALPEVSGFAADLLNAALSEVNWDEIAESLLNDAKAEGAA